MKSINRFSSARSAVEWTRQDTFGSCVSSLLQSAIHQLNSCRIAVRLGQHSKTITEAIFRNTFCYVRSVKGTSGRILQLNKETSKKDQLCGTVSSQCICDVPDYHL